MAVLLTAGAAGLALFAPAASATPPSSVTLGKLAAGGAVRFAHTSAGWGISVVGVRDASFAQPRPVELEFETPRVGGIDGVLGVGGALPPVGWGELGGYQAEPPDEARKLLDTFNDLPVESVGTGYETLRRDGRTVVGTASLAPVAGVSVSVIDRWMLVGEVLTVSRELLVHGNHDGGFMSAFTAPVIERETRPAVGMFAPAIVYGSTAGLPPGGIAGVDTYGSGGRGILRIREDRLPAPLFGVYFPDGRNLTVLDAHPNGASIRADTRDDCGATITDARMRLGALGAELVPGGQLTVGFWYPGSEGTVSPSRCGTGWRWRFHPFANGLTQRYTLDVRLGRDRDFAGYVRGAWRYAYRRLVPVVPSYDIDRVRSALVSMLADRVETVDGNSGFPAAESATTGVVIVHWALMGFVGMDATNAWLLLQDAAAHPDANSARYRAEAEAVISTLTRRVKMDPPAGDGFDLLTGRSGYVGWPSLNGWYLREITDDMTSVLQAYELERRAGRNHPGWLAWVRQFGDWLLSQQRTDGGFPREWKDGTSSVIDPSPTMSYAPVPFLLALGRISGNRGYGSAGVRAGEYTWSSYERTGHYVGGAPDQGGWIDREASVLALQAYLALFRQTGNPVWLHRAEITADSVETWQFLWSVPMAPDESNSQLGWKKGVSMVGFSVAAVNGAGGDEYGAWLVPDYAELYADTGDRHYLSFAHLLLEGSKAMLAIPGRTYDLAGPGWQQENWQESVAARGYGSDRWWRAWVSAAQLTSILGVEALGKGLVRKVEQG